ncbi:MAG: Asp-tRNA(Asn)/Glu-tRNA(Gln) amidotransferase subunit GatA, partial [Chlorobiaceae bacterium]|nr:Asp-tRNA(Asn)/Glu-tRNA(Gln) amidotransferase subunit GatA [Chlorobiaceae bacterium]
MQFRGYEDLRSRLVSRELTCEQVTEAYLQRIDAHRDDNIFTAVFHDAAMQRARELDAKLQRGEALGKLFGMPMAIKDNISMEGAPLTCASKILAGYE